MGKEKREVDPAKVKPVRMNTLDDHDRVSCHFGLLHEHRGEEPLVSRAKFNFLCKKRQQPWKRTLVIGPDWVPITKGMPTDEELDVGLILIENRLGMSKLVMPTQQEKDDMAKRVVEVSCGPLVEYIIRPGLFHFGEVADASKVRIRAVEGSVSVKITLLPR